jgi:adenylate kinase
MLSRHGHALDAVLELEVDEDAIVERLLKRAQTEGRADDTEDVIRERQAIYRKETAPLAQHYELVGLLVKVDGMGAVDEVTDRVIAALPQHG